MITNTRGIISFALSLSLLSGCSLFSESTHHTTTHSTQSQHQSPYVPISHIITFAYDSTTPEQELAELLKPHIDYMLVNAPHARIMLQGSADASGEDGYNFKLALQRANAVKDAFINLGVSPARISVSSAGSYNADSSFRPRSVTISY